VRRLKLCSTECAHLGPLPRTVFSTSVVFKLHTPKGSKKRCVLSCNLALSKAGMKDSCAVVLVVPRSFQLFICLVLVRFSGN
jgi:hypothetical protein